MNRKFLAMAVAISFFAVPVAATDFITKVGEYTPTPTTSVQVYEVDGKLQYRVKAGSKSGGPTKPLINKNASWFIFPENDKRFWISHRPGELELVEFTDGGIVFSSSDVRRNLMELAPAEVRQRLKQTPKN
jgi:hypothetical protein